MRALRHNSYIHYTFIAFVSVALLFSQAFKLHMHAASTQHGLANDGAKFGMIHVASTLHDSNGADTSLVNQTHEHGGHPAEIEISADSVVKKLELFALSIFLVFIIALVLCHRFACRVRRLPREENTRATSLRYLLNPPLRAPPAFRHI